MWFLALRFLETYKFKLEMLTEINVYENFKEQNSESFNFKSFVLN